MKLVDADARTRIREDLDTTFVVEAAAGTGKTSALIGRLLSVLQSGRARLDRIALVTFTEKAAGEMKLRLRTELEQARTRATENGDHAQQAHLVHALSALELAHINTIHGFCADLLRERPIEAGVDPNFEVLDDIAGDRFLHEAFDVWFAQVLADPPEGVRRVLRRFAGSKTERFGPKQQLLEACRTLIEHRDFHAPWTAPVYDRVAEIDAIVRGMAELGALAGAATNPRDYLARALRNFHDFTAELAIAERTRVRDYDALEAQLLVQSRGAQWNWKGSGKFAPDIARDAVLERRAALRAQLLAFLTRAEADLAAKLQHELGAVVALRQARKQKAGALDFVDLLLCTRDLLRGDPRARAELQQRFSHVFVDEFQDTDPLQAEILLWLASDSDTAPALRGGASLPGSDMQRVAPGKLFAVGDPKQSIYRFRRAEVMLYERIKQRLLADGAELLHLTTSFRSVPEIQAVVNASFEKLMQGGDDGSQAAYVALSAFRPPQADQPALIALNVPDAYGSRGDVEKRAVEAAYPQAVAAFVDGLLRHSGLQVEEGGARVPVQARHVCLLFKRLQVFGQDLTRGYVRALEGRRIPHVLVGGRSLHGREEVIALRAALSAIEWPDDELNVYATLHGPLFALDDEDLLRFHTDVGRLHPLRPLAEDQPAQHAEVAEALMLLRDLHRARNRRSTAQTISALLEATRAHAGVAIWPTGEQALANLLTVVDAARSFDRRAALSFRGFVEWLHAEAEQGTGSEAPIVEEGTEGVRLMTVHKAKGLEFPVVVLCDPTAPSEPTFASRYVDAARGLWAQRLCGARPLELQEHEAEILRHDRAESIRLAYVAATRARDLLVVPVVAETRDGKSVMGWTDLLAPAAHAAYVARAATWEPAGELDTASIGGVRQQHLLSATERSHEWISAHERWAARRQATLAAAAAPTRLTHSVTQLAVARAQAAAVVAPEPAAIGGGATVGGVELDRTHVDRRDRPRGRRFGSLVHAVLAQAPLDADAQAIEALVAGCSRLVGATSDEAAAAAIAVTGALAHPWMKRAGLARDCRREVPIVHALADGTLVEGIIDLAFREPEGWVIVDFKTDAELEQHASYAEQVRLYMDAVHAATGEAVRGVLLAV
jgi:ATP-dependent helicase/nuclease subunit A